MTRPRYYIAGAISGEDDYRSKFAMAEYEVAALGYHPVNPCMIHVTCEHADDDWSGFMICDIKAMMNAQGVYALTCWRRSRGATIEVQLALRLGKDVIYQP